jgi:hypothetical protein
MQNHKENVLTFPLLRICYVMGKFKSKIVPVPN